MKIIENYSHLFYQHKRVRNYPPPLPMSFISANSTNYSVFSIVRALKLFSVSPVPVHNFFHRTAETEELNVTNKNLLTLSN